MRPVQFHLHGIGREPLTAGEIGLLLVFTPKLRRGGVVQVEIQYFGDRPQLLRAAIGKRQNARMRGARLQREFFAHGRKTEADLRGGAAAQCQSRRQQPSWPRCADYGTIAA